MVSKRGKANLLRHKQPPPRKICDKPQPLTAGPPTGGLLRHGIHAEAIEPHLLFPSAVFPFLLPFFLRGALSFSAQQGSSKSCISSPYQRPFASVVTDDAKTVIDSGAERLAREPCMLEPITSKIPVVAQGVIPQLCQRKLLGLFNAPY